MRLWKNKTQGYSLIETIIAVFITSLVITVAFGIFYSYNKVFKKYADTVKDTNNVVTVNKVLEKDFEGAKIVKTINENSVKLFFINQTSIEYKVIKDKLVRLNRNSVDTLYHNVGNLILSNIESSNLLNYYGITLFEDDYEYNLNFEKSYSPDVLISELGKNDPSQPGQIPN